MKQIIISIFTFIQLLTSSSAQSYNIDSLNQKAMDYYNEKDFTKSGLVFDLLFSSQNIKDPDILYNASCVYALNNEPKKSLQHLTELAETYLYSDIEHLSTDSDLNNLHEMTEWKILIARVLQNKTTLPQRRRAKIQNELLKTKKLLESDNGMLWSGNIWHDNILVLDETETIYTLNRTIPNSIKDSLIYYKQIPAKTLVHANTNQQFENEKWAIVQNYDITPTDSCQTPIHELFHLFHGSQINIEGNIVEYLDNYKAKIWLRSEFEALRNCIKSIQKNDEVMAKIYLSDGMYFRTERENFFKKQNHFALKLETLEGLASYTGFKLSAHKDLYRMALIELDGRENPNGLNRSFAYATGLAYGLIFDYFHIQWRSDLKHIYSFRDIYKQVQAFKKTPKSKTENIKRRNKYYVIEQEEMKRKITNDSIKLYYKNLFCEQPVLTVKRDTTDKTYYMSYDMNNTFTFDKLGIIYSDISSASANPSAFGNFKTTGETSIGKTGVLITNDFAKLTFPKPTKVEGTFIIGENYTIELNKGWVVKQSDKKGSLEIVKE